MIYINLREIIFKMSTERHLPDNKTIGDEGITVDFWTIKVHTPH